MVDAVLNQDLTLSDKGNRTGKRWKWKCIFGCSFAENQPVIILNCLHYICSDACANRLREEPRKNNVITCRCSNILGAQLPSIKFPLENIFVSKGSIEETTLICENCVWNRPAIAYCPECPACLCLECKHLHPQTRSTQKHKVEEDLTERKKELWLSKNDTKCREHDGLIFTAYCADCSRKICENCRTSHGGHEIFWIDKERKELQSHADNARNFVDILDRAVLDIGNKHEEIISKEWKALTASIDEQFEIMLQIISKRKCDLLKEAKDRLLKQLCALSMRRFTAQKSIERTCEFISVTDEILHNRADVAAVEFLRHHRDFVQRRDLEEQEFKNNFNRIVDKDWHFKLNLSGVAEAQKYLSEMIQVEYSLETQLSGVSNGTGRAHQQFGLESGSSSVSSKKRFDLTNSFVRRVAVKSTGSMQATTRHKKLVKISPTASVNGTCHSARTAGNWVIALPKVGQQGVADAETETEDDQQGFEERKRVKSKPTQEQSNKNEDVDLDVDDVQSNATETIGLADDQLEIDTECPSGDSNGSSSNEYLENLNTEQSEQSVEQINGRKEGAQEDEHTRRGREGPTMSGRLGRSNTCNDRSAEPSEPVLGKRERKKKTYDDFIDLDEFVGVKKQNDEIPARLRPKRKSEIPKPGSSNKVSRMAPKHEREDSLPNMGDDVEGEGENTEVENSFCGYSSDETGSDSGRRQSRRIRTPRPTECPSPARKHVSEHLSYPEAPGDSVEEPPELCDWPVVGQGRMKITHTDENEDYCAVCMDGGDEIIVCCDFCPKVFHLNCHVPLIKQIPEGEAKWRCYYDTTRREIEESTTPGPEGSENTELAEATNERHFKTACKFVMECYGIAEMPTMRWIFPTQYKDLFGRTPYHLKYIRERLSGKIPQPFMGVKDMMQAFRQMFIQAFIFYKKRPKGRSAAIACYRQFLRTLADYYPQHREIFDDVFYDF